MRRIAAGRGFTIVELMIVVAIVAVLAMVGLPSMRDLLKTNNMKTLSLDIYSSLALARSEAIKRNSASVSMIAAGGGWQNGWTVTCVDSAGSCGGADVVLMSQEAVDSNVTLTGPAGNIVSYGRDGRLTTPAVSFRITIGADHPSVPMRCVEVSVSGRPITRADTNHSDSDGCN
jgi:type IV fimbrial biogenesis protein FimT